MPSMLHKKHLEYTIHPMGAIRKRIVYSNAVGYGRGTTSLDILNLLNIF